MSDVIDLDDYRKEWVSDYAQCLNPNCGWEGYTVHHIDKESYLECPKCGEFRVEAIGDDPWMNEPWTKEEEESFIVVDAITNGTIPFKQFMGLSLEAKNVILRFYFWGKND